MSKVFLLCSLCLWVGTTYAQAPNLTLLRLQESLKEADLMRGPAKAEAHKRYAHALKALEENTVYQMAKRDADNFFATPPASPKHPLQTLINNIELNPEQARAQLQKQKSPMAKIWLAYVLKEHSVRTPAQKRVVNDVMRKAIRAAWPEQAPTPLRQLSAPYVHNYAQIDSLLLMFQEVNSTETTPVYLPSWFFTRHPKLAIELWTNPQLLNTLHFDAQTPTESIPTVKYFLGAWLDANTPTKESLWPPRFARVHAQVLFQNKKTLQDQLKTLCPETWQTKWETYLQEQPLLSVMYYHALLNLETHFKTMNLNANEARHRARTLLFLEMGAHQNKIEQ